MDQFYYDSGYLTPDSGFFVYIADADSSISSSSSLSTTVEVIRAVAADLTVDTTVNTTVGKISNASASIDSEFTTSAMLSNIYGADIIAFADAELTAQAERTLTANIYVTSAYTVTADAERTRLISGAFDASADLSGVANRFRNLEAATSAAFSLTTEITVIQSQTVLYAFTSLTVLGGYLKETTSGLNSTTIQSTTASKTTENIITSDSQVVVSSVATITLTVDSTITSEFTQSADADRTRDVNATSSTTASVEAAGEVNKTFDLTINTSATLTMSYELTKEFTCDFESLFTPTMAVNVVVNSFAVIESTSQLLVQAQANLSVSADLSVSSTTNTTINRIQSAAAGLTSQAQLAVVIDGILTEMAADLLASASQVVDVIRIRSMASSQAVETSVSALVNLTSSAVTEIQSTVGLTVDNQRTRSTSAALEGSMILTVSIDGILTEASAALAVTATQLTDNTRIRALVSDINTTTAVSVDAVVITGVTSAIQSTSNLSAAIKVAYVGAVTTQAIATELAIVNKIGRGLIGWDAVVTVTADVGAIRQYVFDGIQGTNGVTDTKYVKYTDNSIEAYSVNPGMVFAFWARRESGSTGKFIWNKSEYPTVAGYQTKEFSLGYSNQDFTLRAYDENGSGGGNARVNLSWANSMPSNTQWHHYIVEIYAYSGAFPGTFNAKLWVDGSDQGQKSTTGPNTYGLTSPLYSPMTIGSITGSMAQVGIWQFPDPNVTPLNTALLYNSGYVTLPDTGVISGITPVVYELFDDPFSSKIQGATAVGTTETTHTITSAYYADVPLRGIYGEFFFDIQFNAGLFANSNIQVVAQLTATPISQYKAAAALEATATQTTNAVKLKRAIANLQATSQLTVQSGSTNQGSANFEVNTDVSTQAVKITDAASVISANTQVNTQAIRLRGTPITISVQSDLAVVAEKLTDVVSSITSEFTETIQARTDFSARADLTAETQVVVESTVIQGSRTFVNVEANLTASAQVTARTLIDLSAQATLLTQPGRIRDFTIALNAFDTVLAVGLKIVIDPFLTLYIEPEARTLYIIEEDRNLLVEQETSELRIRMETRDLLIDEEQGNKKIKGYAQ